MWQATSVTFMSFPPLRWRWTLPWGGETRQRPLFRTAAIHKQNVILRRRRVPPATLVWARLGRRKPCAPGDLQGSALLPSRRAAALLRTAHVAQAAHRLVAEATRLPQPHN